MDEDEIEVRLEPEAPVDVQIEGEGKTQQPDPAQELKAQFEEEKAARVKAEHDAAARQSAVEAERRAREAAEREASQAKAETADAHLERVLSEISSSEIEAQSGEAEYATAMQTADYLAAAKAQRKIASAEAKIVRLNEAKAYLETAKKAPPPQRQQQDPIEQFISSKSQPAQAWLREHRDWITDPQKSSKLTEAHYNAVNNGIPVDTPEYFKHVETHIGLRQDRQRDDSGRFVSQDDTPKPQRAKPPPAAPVNGGAGNNAPSSNTGNMVTLHPWEARSATDGTHVWGKHDLAAGRIKDASLIGKPIGHTEFARRKREMQKSGLYDRVYVEQ